MRVLGEVNSLTDEHDQFVKSLGARVDAKLEGDRF
jgi:hypothetical protein